MIDEQPQRVALRCRDGKFRTIAGEDGFTIRLQVIDMGADVADSETVAGHQPHINAALVIAVDQHDVPVRHATFALQQRVIEALEGYAIFCLDCRKHVGVHIANDICRVQHRAFVDSFGTQLNPSQPVGSSIRNHFDAAAPWPLDEATAILPQQHELTGIGFLQIQRFQQHKHAGLVGRGIIRLVDERIQFAEVIKHRVNARVHIPVQGARAVKQVFNIIGGNAHDCCKPRIPVTD